MELSITRLFVCDRSLGFSKVVFEQSLKLQKTIRKVEALTFLPFHNFLCKKPLGVAADAGELLTTRSSF